MEFCEQPSHGRGVAPRGRRDGPSYRS